MDENALKTADFTTFLAENPTFLEKFKESLNAVPQTQASALLKNGSEEIGLKKISPKQIEQYLWMHPVVPRGIEIKANRMTSRGYRVEAFDDSSDAKEAAARMKSLLDNSGGEILLNGWIQDGFAFGNGYYTLLPDKNSKEIVLIAREHPIFFRIARSKKEDKTNKKISYDVQYGDWDMSYGPMKIDPVTKKPLAYTQVAYNQGSDTVVPIGKELSADQVAHLVFDTWGDEAEGISYIQYVHLLLKYMMNIEEAGAEGIFRSGFTQKKVVTDINNEKDLKKLAKNLDGINAADSIILPKGTDVENLLPGQTEFVPTHDLFLNLIAMRIGVPKPILTLDGSDINKATMDELMKDMINDIRADELKVKKTIEEQIFIPACDSIFGKSFTKYPRFFFNDFTESMEIKSTILESAAKSIQSLTQSYVQLKQNGANEMAGVVLALIKQNIPVFGNSGQTIDSLEKDAKELTPDGSETIQGTEPRVKEVIPKDSNPRNGDITAE